MKAVDTVTEKDQNRINSDMLCNFEILPRRLTTTYNQLNVPTVTK